MMAVPEARLVRPRPRPASAGVPRRPPAPTGAGHRLQRSPGSLRALPPAQLALLARAAGNRALNLQLQKCGAGCGCGPCGAALDEDGGTGKGTPALQRRVEPKAVEAMAASKVDGAGGAMEQLNGLSQDDQVDTIRAMPAGHRQLLEAALRYGGGGGYDIPRLWLAVTIAGADPMRAKQAAEVHGLIRAGQFESGKPPYGAVGLLAGLKQDQRLGVLRLLHADHVMALAEHLPNSSPSQGGISRDVEGVKQALLEAVRTTPDLAVKRVPFDLAFVGRELVPSPRTGTTAAGTSAYVLSQGEHALFPSTLTNGRRFISTGYWKALVPEARAVELERVLNQVPRDLSPRLESFIAEQVRTGKVPPGSPVQFGQKPMIFTAQELAEVPALVGKVNSGGISALTAREAQVLSGLVDIHVDGVPAQVRVGAMSVPGGGSPLVSWSTPGKTPTSTGTKRFTVKAEFDRQVVFDNTRPNAVHPEGNAAEAEWLATAGGDARVTSVRSLAEEGGLGTSWAYRNSTALRWGGRGLLVVSIGWSVAKVLSADTDHFTQVLGEEVGSQAGGFAGAALGAAACVGLGIATGGVGLLACGLVGGIVGGSLGGAVGGSVGAALDHEVMPKYQSLEDSPFFGPALLAAAAPPVLEW